MECDHSSGGGSDDFVCPMSSVREVEKETEGLKESIRQVEAYKVPDLESEIPVDVGWSVSATQVL